jgi:hypothetical protein
MTRRDREQRLYRAWLTGELSVRDYAWLWRSLDRYGRHWRWN